MNRSLRYAVLIPLSVLAFYALFVMPGINLDWLGNLAIFAVAWLVWYLLWATMKKSAAAAKTDETVATISPSEQRAWVGLIFTVGILIYFALHSAQMVAPDGSMAPRASRIGQHIVMLIIFGLIVMRVLRKRWRDAVKQDERDRIIHARANRWARIALSIFVLSVAILFALSPLDHLQWAKPMAISNLMMFGLIACSVLGYLVTGVTYWRERH
ncbi:MAG: DUF2178 domain-containing protein [Gammaproteobacteria bacterium]